MDQGNGRTGITAGEAMTERREDIALELARKVITHLQNYCNLDVGELAHEQLAALLRPHVWEWIPVEERSPQFTQTWRDGKDVFKESDAVLVNFEGREPRVGLYEGSGVWAGIGGEILQNVTHWAALPSAPLSLESKGEKNDCV